MPRFHVGVSGWSYPHWRSAFYPPGLPARRQLAYIAERLPSVEVNASFYALQRPGTWRRWYDETPPGFVFAVKGSRFITHRKKLRDVEVPLANFLASGLLCLREKLGPLVWQLAPRHRLDLEKIDAFLRLLPRDTAAAARLARGHDPRFTGRTAFDVDARRPLRHALEVRHPSFLVPPFVDLLRRHRVALAISDAAGWPRVEEVTADFVYARLHGAEHTYASRYDDAALAAWAARLRRWAAGSEPPDARRVAPGPSPPPGARDVYVYFDNDAQAHAPHDALRLLDLLEAGAPIA